MTPGAKSADEGRQPRRREHEPGPTPLSSGDIRRANAWSVLEAVRAGGTVSRAHIVERTGLTAMTVHRLTDDLRRRRLVLPAGTSAAGAVGRPSSLFRLNGSIGHAIGLDVGNETTRAALVDLGRNRLAELDVGTAVIESDLSNQLLTVVARLQHEAGVDPGTLRGLAAGIAGVIRSDGTIIRASQHHVWDGLALGSLLGEALGVHVDLRQDDHLATLAELRSGACVGMSTALVVNVGKGIGLGIIEDGAVQMGAHGAAGRVTWVPLLAEESAAASMVAGDVLTGDGIVADYLRAGGARGTGGARAVFAAAAEGDPAAGDAIGLFASRLGWLVGSAIAIIDPEAVVLGGGVSRGYDQFRERLRRRVEEIVPSPPPIIPSPLGPAAVIAGAIDAALAIVDASLQELLAL
ncbi:MAG: ROK family protein [Candidatus Limnocylindrales bacterium]